MWRDYGDYDNDSGTDPDLTDLDTGSDSSSQCSEHSSLSEAPGEEAVGDYGGETYIPDKQPVAKRVRTDKGTDIGTALAAKRSGRRKKSLSLIVTVPIDILLEIFGLLEPVDLSHLFHAHKAFRKVLSSNHAVSVWKAARVNRGGVPDCMPGMSEVEWADLLFDGSDSQECGKKRVWDIDFGMRRRVCQPCLNENLVCKSAFPFVFPEYYDPIILDLIPFSSIGVEDHDHDYIVDLGCKFFWSDDIEQMAKELEVYLKPGAEQALEDFKQSRKKYVDSDSNHIAVCEAWVTNDRAQQSLHAHELRSQNTKLFEARLVDLGHDAEDVERMFDHHHYGVLDKEFTDARWKRLIPKVERKLAQLQEEWRLEKQRRVSSVRESALLTMYDKYVWSLPQGIIPPPGDFLELCDIAEFIKSPPTRGTKSDAFDAKIPEFCAEYMHKKKLELTRLLILSTDAVQDTTALQNQGINPPSDMLLQLATSVFQCTYPQSFPLITWDKVKYHGRSSHSRRPRSSCAMTMSTSPCTFSVSKRGVAAACSLLSLVGLDANTTTATTMDDLQSYRMAMNWRQSVFHYVGDQSPSHEEPRWELLSTAQLQVIQSRTIPEYPAATQQVWRCNKCDVYHRDSTTKAKVIKHMRSRHGSTTPTEGINFSYDQSVIEKPPPGTKFFVTPQIKKPLKPSTTQKSKPSTKSVYRCKHCNGLDRTFVLEGVKQHIKVKHGIKSPHEGPDLYKIK
ncbi:hypothetical protein BDR06DRAFT_954429 [Suillus hirtellus]|nr:hypothetical protein BDR06DRAFT_954429 [Suillus hirtellus]